MGRNRQGRSGQLGAALAMDASIEATGVDRRALRTPCFYGELPRPSPVDSELPGGLVAIRVVVGPVEVGALELARRALLVRDERRVLALWYDDGQRDAVAAFDGASSLSDVKIQAAVELVFGFSGVNDRERVECGTKEIDAETLMGAQASNDASDRRVTRVSPAR